MGSATKTLQSVIDYLRIGGDLVQDQDVSGYAVGPFCDIANDTMSKILGEDFPWKFNSYKLTPFYTNSLQQDYPSITESNIGWLEHCIAVDINNTSLPKPKWHPVCERDLEPTSFQCGPPRRVSWEYNSNLDYGVWPGANQVYVPPISPQTPTNPPAAILDAAGNILTLTTYGTTGSTPPLAGIDAGAGVTILDGTCVWTVCDPNAQGFRLGELPPQNANIYKIFLLAQAKPIPFTTLDQTLDPLPDDYASVFREGFKVHAMALSENPRIRAEAPAAVAMWQGSIGKALKKGDREAESKGFVPDRSVMGGGYWGRIGPGDPYRWYR